MTPTRTMTPTSSYSPSNYDNVSYYSTPQNDAAPVVQEIIKVNLAEPIKANSSSISLSNVDPSTLNTFKEGNTIVSDDGRSSYKIISVIITYYTPSPSSNSNYSENFKEGIDGAAGSIKSIDIILDKPTEKAMSSINVIVPATPVSTSTTPSSYSAAPSSNTLRPGSNRTTPSSKNIASSSNTLRPGSNRTTPNSYIAAPSSNTLRPGSNRTTPSSYSAASSSNNTALNNSDLTDITNKIEKKLVDDIVNGINTKFTPGSQCNSYNSAMLNAPYNSNYGSQYQPQYQPQYQSQYQPQTGPSSNPVVRPKTNNVFQSGNMSVNLAGQTTNDTPGQLPSISESKAQVNFPNMESPSDMYSYYGALRTKGADYVPFNAISETNKKLGKLGYVPPPLPMNYDFTYYGALPSKGADNAKAVNALQGPNQNNYTEQILDGKLYAITGQPGYEELPIPNRVDYMKLPQEMNANQVSTFSSTPIDSYSQYGALRSKE